MRISSILAAGAAAALLMTPAGAIAGNGTPPKQAKAYGKYCQGFSKKHVNGRRGTPFSRCVVAMAHLASNKAKTPKAACKGFSKKHHRGRRGTAFSRCVKAGRKLENDLDRRYGGDEDYADPFGDD